MAPLTHEWPVAFFDDDYLRIYGPTFTPERTSSEVDFIEGALALPRGATVLDLACGIGRHALGMAARGYRVTGVDFNTRYLELAGEAATRDGLTLRLEQGDMRALGYAGEFAGIYSYFTSFGYFSDDENEKVLAGVAQALAPRGRFLIDMASRDWLLTHPQNRTWTQRDDGALFVEETSIELIESRIVSRQILIEPGGGPQVTKEYRLRAYTCAELSALLRRHGLIVREVWGGPDRQAFGTESRRLVLLSERA
ncbi:MAG TPA: class I SAM-dependent methyltransferase [Candidatus Acidoferrales bacterium]|nr:class I SAM-dependent methyltransferase [Candidatus Acidoferrales bacterium]